MSKLLEAALEYASSGWAVFPLHGVVNGLCTCGRQNCSSPGKHPLVRRGLKDASRETRVIKEWFRRWKRANLAIVTGSVSGLVVIDIDLPAALPSLDALMHAGLVPTLTGVTGGGGLHLLYSCSDEGLGNSAGRLPGIERDLPGVDLRASGGYVVAPPSVHRSGGRYEWLNPYAPIAASPSWLASPPPQIVDLGDVRPIEYVGDGTAYGRAALQSALTCLRQAPVGQRNHTLNKVTFALAQLVAGGELLEAVVRRDLLAGALAAGLDEPESRQTIESALSAGAREPRVAPQ